MITARVNIKNLLLRTIIGFNDWEREKKQDILVNVSMEIDIGEAIKTDNVDSSVDYKVIAKRIVFEVEKSSFNLLESLANLILNIIMEHKKVIKGTVEVDKPHSIRYSESTSVVVSSER